MQPLEPARHTISAPLRAITAPATAISAAVEAWWCAAGAAVSPRIGQPARGDQQADPLPAAELEAEEPLSDDRQEHQPAGDDGLHDRQRRQRQRADVQQPRAERDQPAHRPPLAAKQTDRAANRTTRENDRCRDGAALLEQDRDAARQRAADRQQQARDHPLVPVRSTRRSDP